MSESRKDLQNVYADILKDMMAMSADVIKKSNILLNDVESLDPISQSVDSITNNIQTLLDRVNTNLTSFVNTFNTATQAYRDACQAENSKAQVSPKPKSKLSLRRNGTTQETDVDLTTSDDETNAPVKRELKLTDSPQKNSQKSPTKEAETDGSASDTDSEKTVQYFDVPVTNGLAEGLSDGDDTHDDFDKTLDELDKVSGDESEKLEKITKPEAESMSFDFDDADDDLVAEMDKYERNLKMGENSDDLATEMDNYERNLKMGENSDDLAAEMDKYERNLKMVENSETRERTQRDNNELLEMLTKAVDSSQETEKSIEEEADEALKILEDEISSSSDVDSDESDAPSVIPSNIESEDEGNISDTESLSEEKEPEYELKQFSIDMEKRVDDMDDAEVDRLCDIHNLNKRKCFKALNRVKKKKRKRIRLLSSSSSSSSLSSDLSSHGSSTPDLVIDTQRLPTPDVDMADVTVLADELVDRLEKEDDVDMSSLDSETDIDDDDSSKEEEEEKSVKTKDKPKVEVERPEKKTGSWRNDIRLWSSDDEDSRDSVFEIIADDPEDPPNEARDSGDDKEDVPKLGIISEVTTVISDSESTDSDEVTFVDEVLSDTGSGRGGRRNIRAILSDDELNVLTQRAKNEEDARILRLEKHSRTIESVQSQHEEEFILDADVETGRALVTVDSTLAQMLKPHQKDGVQFMWEACYESVEMLKTKPGTGCILAHCMGLGKTLQVITLVHTLFTHPVTNTKHVLIICPLSTVHNWQNEIKNNFSRLREYPRLCYRFIVKEDLHQKVGIVSEWRRLGGILVMGYECFQILTNDKTLTKMSPREKQLITESLLNPGPDLIVCDEGHQLKNGKTLKTKAVMKVKTKRRIILTGTPLQNNLEEYYWMVHFVKPHLLGTSAEYTNRFTTPIKNGQYQNSRPEDIKLMKKRTHVLTKILKKTVHRVEASVLAKYLPPIMDYTVFVKLTELQMKLYIKYISSAQTKISSTLYFNDCAIMGLNNLHPYALHLHYSRPKSKSKKKKKDEEEELNDDELDVATDVDARVSQDWYKDLFPNDIATNVGYSTKLQSIFDILDETRRLGEKTLIFVKLHAELDLLEHFLKMRSWRPNVEYLRMDGQTPADERDKVCKRFNGNPTIHAFLLTHRTGGLGLNLTGANRVIMIGSNYNPSLDTQSMYRVYRFGQEKDCFVYRMLSLGTMEEKIYNKCVVKLHLSGTVVDRLHFGRPFNNDDLQGMYRIEFDNYDKPRPIPVVPTDKLMALLLQNTDNIYRYYLHNSLLENRPEEELTDEDKKLAWEEFNNLQENTKQVPVVVHPQAHPVVAPQLINYSRLAQWNNASNLVPNPMNNNTRGFIPRTLIQNGTLPNNPQLVNTNQNVVSNNPFLQLFNTNNRAHTSGYNRSISNVVHTLKEMKQRFERSRENIPTNFGNRSRDIPEVPPTGEFNYALNKVV